MLKNPQLAYELALKSKIIGTGQKTSAGQWCYPHTLEAVYAYAELILQNKEVLESEAEKILA
jgi:hypothetical protein